MISWLVSPGTSCCIRSELSRTLREIALTSNLQSPLLFQDPIGVGAFSGRSASGIALLVLPGRIVLLLGVHRWLALMGFHIC
jgi:hypothetical protein